jgi:UDP:flavonoid glycosyltransferase YjiC (YdhE family)
MVAKAIAGTGAGITLAKRARPAEIRGALERVLHEPSYRDAATALGARMRARNGPAAAADLILRASRRELRRARPRHAEAAAPELGQPDMK